MVGLMPRLSKLLFYLKLLVVLIFFSRPLFMLFGYWHPYLPLTWSLTPSLHMYTLHPKVSTSTSFKLINFEDKYSIDLLKLKGTNFLFENQMTNNLLYTLLSNYSKETFIPQKANSALRRSLCKNLNTKKKTRYTLVVTEKSLEILKVDIACEN
jgi:hypothetical protein